MSGAAFASALGALQLACGVWTLLLLAALAAPALGDAASFAGVGLALALVAATRRPPVARAGFLSALLAGAAGFASLPAWLGGLAPAGSALGLEPRPPLAPAPGALRAVCDLLLGPALEELLYRERMLPALRAACGAPLAVVLSSALFALPHRDPWLVLAAFGVGLVLGAAFLATGSTPLCIAAHVGLNLAALAWLRSGGGLGAPASASALIAPALFAAALARARAKAGPA
jgi:membrane protease YdiL (CAAX protease family)